MDFDAKHEQELELVHRIVKNANRVPCTSTVWSAEIDGTLYFVHKRDSARESWHTVHVGSVHGPRVSNL